MFDIARYKVGSESVWPVWLQLEVHKAMESEGFDSICLVAKVR